MASPIYFEGNLYASYICDVTAIYQKFKLHIHTGRGTYEYYEQIAYEANRFESSAQTYSGLAYLNHIAVRFYNF